MYRRGRYVKTVRQPNRIKYFITLLNFHLALIFSYLKLIKIIQITTNQWITNLPAQIVDLWNTQSLLPRFPFDIGIVFTNSKTQ